VSLVRPADSVVPQPGNFGNLAGESEATHPASPVTPGLVMILARARVRRYMDEQGRAEDNGPPRESTLTSAAPPGMLTRQSDPSEVAGRS
jgi:hypothetical protein